MHRFRLMFHAVAAASLLLAPVAFAADATDAEKRQLEELRNTVVNLLQGLVEKGVLTREQAEQMVRNAQSKAEVDTAARVAQQKAEEGAVRVPYVPQVVKDEIRRQVSADLGEQVTKNVLSAAQEEGWGAPAALPDWIRRMRWYGDVRVRGQGDLFASDNRGLYDDYQRINEAGGILKAGTGSVINTTEDRERLRSRLRLGMEAALGYGWTLGARVATGSLRDPVSTNQTLGNYGFRNTIGLDLAYIDWTGASRVGRNMLSVSGGRIRNPFFTGGDIVYDPDLSFEGVAASYKFGLDRRDPGSRTIFVNAGAFPLQEVELSSHDKWLLGGQVGLDWKYAGGSRTRVAASLYDFRNISGRYNDFESNLFDYTAPQYVRLGNTMFNIRNDNDPSTELFALAADYRLFNVSLVHDWRVSAAHRMTLSTDFVRNIGFDRRKMRARAGFDVERRDVGYQTEVAFGSAVMTDMHSWRAAVGYRYLERDAVLDAFTDSDFRLGGTDSKGYYFVLDYNLTPKVVSRLRYMSGNEIDGNPLGIDVLQLDLTASF
jgi:hypothetical protein